jgi:hypothetical protein
MFMFRDFQPYYNEERSHRYKYYDFPCKAIEEPILTTKERQRKERNRFSGMNHNGMPGKKGKRKS